MKKNKIREILAVMGVAVALTACGQSNAPQSEPVSEETQQDNEADSKTSDSDADETPAATDAASDTADTDTAGDDAADDAVNEEASLDDGVYFACYNVDAVKDADAKKGAYIAGAVIKDGELEILGSLEQLDDSGDQIAYYEVEVRDIAVADDFAVRDISFDADTDEEIYDDITIDDFNSMFSDMNSGALGLGLKIEIEDGEVTIIDIFS